MEATKKFTKKLVSITPQYDEYIKHLVRQGAPSYSQAIRSVIEKAMKKDASYLAK